jgi:hypothetical protein
MARSKIVEIGQDLMQDPGSVLFSFVQGEQLELPVSVDFIENIGIGYTFEAVVVEALNEVDQANKPTQIKPGGIQTVLLTRVPQDRGIWSQFASYNKEDVCLYGGLYYKLYNGLQYQSATTPDQDLLWVPYSPNIVNIQFPKTLSLNWSQAPTTVTPVYGFFELRVTEPTNTIFTHTWKPVRGMIEIHFSPTELVT